MIWPEVAEKEIRAVPWFVRKKAREAVEQRVASQDRTLVTLEDVVAVREQAMERVLGARRRSRPESGGDSIDLAAFVGAAEADADRASVIEPEFSVRVCGAAGGCPMAVGDVIAARDAMLEELHARRVADVVRAKAHGPLLAHHRCKVSISGCPNSCSQPQIADFGMVAREVPAFDQSLCISCGACVDACDEAALHLDGGAGVSAGAAATEDLLVLDRDLCVGCGACVRVCPTGALVTGESGWRVMAGGRLGRHPRLARDLAMCTDLADARARLGRLVRLWEQEGLPDERIGAMLERVLAAGPTRLDEPAGGETP